MRHIKLTLVLFTLVAVLFKTDGQNSLPALFVWDTDYSDCAAIIYNGKMLVDEYSPKGKCKLNFDSKGKLKVSTVNLTKTGGVPKQALQFLVAIKNTNTNTIWMYTKTPVTEIDIEEVVKECKKDDKLIFLTIDKKIALTHNEVEVIVGC